MTSKSNLTVTGKAPSTAAKEDVHIQKPQETSTKMRVLKVVLAIVIIATAALALAFAEIKYSALSIAVAFAIANPLMVAGFAVILFAGIGAFIIIRNRRQPTPQSTSGSTLGSKQRSMSEPVPGPIPGRDPGQDKKPTPPATPKTQVPTTITQNLEEKEKTTDPIITAKPSPNTTSSNKQSTHDKNINKSNHTPSVSTTLLNAKTNTSEKPLPQPTSSNVATSSSIHKKSLPTTSVKLSSNQISNLGQTPLTSKVSSITISNTLPPNLVSSKKGDDEVSSENSYDTAFGEDIVDGDTEVKKVATNTNVQLKPGPNENQPLLSKSDDQDSDSSSDIFFDDLGASQVNLNEIRSTSKDETVAGQNTPSDDDWYSVTDENIALVENDGIVVMEENKSSTDLSSHTTNAVLSNNISNTESERNVLLSPISTASEVDNVLTEPALKEKLNDFRALFETEAHLASFKESMLSFIVDGTSTTEGRITTINLHYTDQTNAILLFNTETKELTINSLRGRKILLGQLKQTLAPEFATWFDSRFFFVNSTKLIWKKRDEKSYQFSLSLVEARSVPFKAQTRGIPDAISSFIPTLNLNVGNLVQGYITPNENKVFFENGIGFHGEIDGFNGNGFTKKLNPVYGAYCAVYKYASTKMPVSIITPGASTWYNGGFKGPFTLDVNQIGFSGKERLNYYFSGQSSHGDKTYLIPLDSLKKISL